MRRGEIWTANLNPVRGAEIGKIRPVVILQADWLTESGSDTVLVVPLTTQRRESLDALRVTINSRDQLRKTCQTVVEKTRAVDRSRFGIGPLTVVTDQEMAALEQHLKGVMGML
ncbi:MAG: type II toxin-antitoxin system PemK/MazF family toxin [Gammaproteobacteria bacterium]|jgi:mRNA interferase MazF|nr:type II toxin-antitoxin system PemK/MazF family toxin [Gammaproteobacteria bacterium]